MKKNIGYESLLGLSLFKEEILDSYLLHFYKSSQTIGGIEESFAERLKSKLENDRDIYIIHCYLFENDPRNRFDKSQKYPDILIGTDSFHTPNFLLNAMSAFFSRKGKSIERYESHFGCFVPKEFLNSNNRVKGIKIGFNTLLCDKEIQSDEQAIEFLQGEINEYLDSF